MDIKKDIIGFIKENKLILLTIFIVSIIYLTLIWYDIKYILGLFSDDSFYYFKIGQNIANGNGVTFDTINSTNGFNPLWQLVIIPIYYIIPNNPILSLKIIFTLQVIIMALCMILLTSIISKRVNKQSTYFLIPFFVTFFFHMFMLCGMETGLLVLLTLLFIWYFFKYDPLKTMDPRKSDIFFGIILGLIFLARLDHVFLLFSIFIFVVITFYNSKEFQLKKIKFFKRVFIKLFVLFLPVVILILPYIMYNYFFFNHILPISGALKSTFPVPMINFSTIMALSFAFWIFSLSILYMGSSLLQKFPMKKQKNLKRISGRLFINIKDAKKIKFILNILALFIIFHFLYNLFFMKWAVAGWYFPLYLLFAFLLGILILNYITNVLRNRFHSIKNIAFSFMAIIVFCIAILGNIAPSFSNIEGFNPDYRGDWQYESYKAAMWAKENTSPNAILAMTDCGTFAYFSERRVINLDGLVNNYEYQDYLHDGNFAQYLKDKNVTYLVTHNANIEKINFDYNFTSYSHLYDCLGGGVILTKEQKVYSSTYMWQGHKLAFVIWKLTHI